MEIGAIFASYIYVVSSCLLLPVLTILSLSTIWLLVYSGRFLAAFLARKRISHHDDAIDALQEKKFSGFSFPVRCFIDELLLLSANKKSDVAILNLLRKTETNLWKSLDPLKILVRVGPGLGLIGTLIPMGTGLAGLSQGDISRLTGDLVIAFTTTVVGMAVGLISYCLFTLQRRWLEDDLRNIELAAEVLANSEQATKQDPTGQLRN